MDKNLTGEQIQKVMDMLLYKALEPIMLYSNVFDSQVSYVLSIVTRNRKRKLSSVPREELVESLATVLTHPDPAYKFKTFRECRIERSFIHCFIKRFLELNQDFLPTYHRFLIEPNAENKAAVDNMAYIGSGCDKRADMYRMVTQASAYLNKFYAFRSATLDNYLRHSSTQAKARITQTQNNQLDFHDLKQSILKAMVVALDKYDSSKGALTTYINWWVLNAQTCSSDHEYGVAYTVPQSQKRKLAEGRSTEVNFSVSLDALKKPGEDDERNLYASLSDGHHMDDDFDRLESQQLVQLLAKEVDRNGVARLTLDIGEFFTREERELMRAHTLEENC
jgi:hypothetical protein